MRSRPIREEEKGALALAYESELLWNKFIELIISFDLDDKEVRSLIVQARFYLEVQDNNSRDTRARARSPPEMQNRSV